MSAVFFVLFLLGYRGIVHPPSDDIGTERTWFEPEQRPRKRQQFQANVSPAHQHTNQTELDSADILASPP